jgi:hypothetical protein
LFPRDKVYGVTKRFENDSGGSTTRVDEVASRRYPARKIAPTCSQAGQLRQRLDAQYRAGRPLYDMHKSREALATCIAQSYNGNHQHFVDGCDGGYALAARAKTGVIACQPGIERAECMNISESCRSGYC